MSINTVLLEELMVHGQPSVDPRNSPTEEFELFSIPSYDQREPEHVLGSEVGSSKKIVEPSDLLLSRIVPHIRRAWVVPACNGKRQIASSEWIVFRHDSFEPRYLRHFVMGDPFHAQFMNTVAGVGGSLVRARPENVGRIEVSLPPLPEQKRIADILDKADAIRRKRQEAIKASDSFLRSTFLEMFGGPGNPVSKTRPLSDVAVIVMGTSPPGNTYNEVGEGEPLINGPVEFGKEHPVEVQWTSKPVKMSEAGDILFCVRGATAGKLNWSDKPYCIGRGIAAIRSKGEDRSHDQFVYLCLALGYEYFQRIGTGSTFININRSVLETFQIPVATEDQIAQIRGIATILDRARVKQEQSRCESESLFNSLVQRAFKGNL